MSIKAASTSASLSCCAVFLLSMPVWTSTVKPKSCFIFAMAGMNCSSGTEPSGEHPPLMRQPKAPFCLSSVQSSMSFCGVLAGCMVSRTFPSQCLQFNAQPLPVMETVGNSVGLEW